MIRHLDDWLLLPQRFALHEPTATAVLADLHLGYSAARQQAGDAIPFRTTREELAPLVEASGQHTIARLVVAGDLFERRYDAEIFRHFVEVLAELRIAFTGLVPGNHDRGLDESLPLFKNGYVLKDWNIVHGDQPVDHAMAVMGHWHPAVRKGGRKLPCFMTRGTHLVLPAFSLDAAGADVRKDPRWRDWTQYPID